MPNQKITLEQYAEAISSSTTYEEAGKKLRLIAKDLDKSLKQRLIRLGVKASQFDQLIKLDTIEEIKKILHQALQRLEQDKREILKVIKDYSLEEILRVKAGYSENQMLKQVLQNRGNFKLFKEEVHKKFPETVFENLFTEINKKTNKITELYLEVKIINLKRRYPQIALSLRDLPDSIIHELPFVEETFPGGTTVPSTENIEKPAEFTILDPSSNKYNKAMQAGFSLTYSFFGRPEEKRKIPDSGSEELGNFKRNVIFLT